METFRLENMIRGWFVGNFNPSVHKTNEFEVGVKKYNAGDYEERHYHKIATEITLILEGSAKMDGQIYSSGDIIKIPPNVSTDFLALEPTTTIVVKIPCASDDKFLGKCND